MRSGLNRNFNLPPGFTLRDIEPLTALHCDGCGVDLRLDRAWTREKGGMALYDEFYCDACAHNLRYATDKSKQDE